MSDWIGIGKQIMDEMNRTRLTLLAAGVAFYGLLALFPGIGAVMALGGIFASPDDITGALDTLDGVLPAEAAGIISEQAREVAGASSDGLGLVAIIGLLLTIYSASKGAQALIDGLNAVTRREDQRSFVRQYALRLGLTFGLLVGALLCIGVAVVVPAVLGWLPLPSSTEWLVTAARWPVLLVIAAIGIALTYRLAPAGENPPWRWILPGAALACVLWILGSAAFAVYVRMFGSYQETFGALGGVVILLMWLWVSATFVLLGALVARVLRERAGGRDTQAEAG